MNIKRGLIRVWIVFSIIWVAYNLLLFLGIAPPYAPVSVTDLTYQDYLVITVIIIVPVAVAWAALYTVFWLARGFKGKQ